MNQIQPLTHWDVRRRFITPACTWTAAISRLDRLVADGLCSPQLSALAKTIARHSIAARFHASTCMSGFVISDTPDFQSVNGVLHIAHRRDDCLFVFHHIALDERQQYAACPEPEALPMFELYLQQHFLTHWPQIAAGLYDGKTPEAALQPKAESPAPEPALRFGLN